jgi:hypothetical protein
MNCLHESGKCKGPSRKKTNWGTVFRRIHITGVAAADGRTWRGQLLRRLEKRAQRILAGVGAGKRMVSE